MQLEKTVQYKGEVDMIGQLLAQRYQILQVLGAGAFGQTYIAQDTHIPGNPTCVVKHLKPATNSPKLLETARQLFQREAETLVKLGKHDQIPQLFAYFEENKEFYLVQEFIEGHTLSTELLPGQPLPESQTIQLLEEILNILEFVHSHGVIHRDIKPDNIMRRQSDGKLVLIDFGAIKQVQNQQFSTTEQEHTVATSTRIGTPGYSPTEQDRGKPRPSSDIYAVGMVGIQALTGVYPNQLQDDEETGEIIWQHKAQVSPALAAILTKMVRYHFKDRYQSVVEALQALQQFKNPSPAPTLQTPIIDSVSHWVPTRRRDRSPQAGREQATTSPQPIEPTVLQPRQNTTSNSSSDQSLPQGSVPTNLSSSTSKSKLSLLMTLGVAALLSVGGGFAYLQSHSSNSGTRSPLIAKSDATRNSATTGTSIAKSDLSANSVKTDTSIAKSDSSPKLDTTDTSIAKSDSSPKLDTTDTSTAKPDSTPNSDKTDISTAKPDSTPNSDKTDTSTAKPDSTPNSDKTDTSTAQPDSNEPLLDSELILLENARHKASEGDFPGAIAQAEQISSHSSIYQQAQDEIARWQEQQEQKVARQQAENQARKLLDQAIEVAKRGGDTDIESAIKLATDAIAQAPPDSEVSKEAKGAIAQWQKEATAKAEQKAKEATAKAEQKALASSYTCYCQPNAPDAQKPLTSTKSENDLTGVACAVDKEPEAKAVGQWQCTKQSDKLSQKTQINL